MKKSELLQKRKLSNPDRDEHRSAKKDEKDARVLEDKPAALRAVQNQSELSLPPLPESLHDTDLNAGSAFLSAVLCVGNPTWAEQRIAVTGDPAREEVGAASPLGDGLHEQCSGSKLRAGSKEFAAPAPLLFRKLSNPDLSPSTGKVKLQRQLSQDDNRPRRSRKQLLPLSSSMHSGVSQLAWQQPGEPTNLVRMKNQTLGQSAPSLTGPEDSLVVEVLVAPVSSAVHAGISITSCGHSTVTSILLTVVLSLQEQSLFTSAMLAGFKLPETLNSSIRRASARAGCAFILILPSNTEHFHEAQAGRRGEGGMLLLPEQLHILAPLERVFRKAEGSEWNLFVTVVCGSLKI
ncbi:MAST2 kinase, partial [Polyodon spathula]|nr:MAST2 kinase [Polyodon spathula]